VGFTHGYSRYAPFRALQRYFTNDLLVLQVAQDLPDDASIEDAMERLLFLAKIEKGLQQADAGETIPHAHVKDRLAKWLK